MNYEQAMRECLNGKKVRCEDWNDSEFVIYGENQSNSFNQLRFAKECMCKAHYFQKYTSNVGYGVYAPTKEDKLSNNWIIIEE